MFLIGIDIGKLRHAFSIVDSNNGEILHGPSFFTNDRKGFDSFIRITGSFDKASILIGMEDTGHYHLALLKFLLDRSFQTALINPVATDLSRKIVGGITKTDKMDTLTICDLLSSHNRKKPYRISKFNSFDLYEQRQLTREHHTLKEQLNMLANRLQKSIDVVFPEYNSLFNSKYGSVYMDILRSFGNADTIAHTDIRTLRKCFDIKGKGRRIPLTPEVLKEAAKNSIGIPSAAETIQIGHLVDQIQLVNEQITDIDKKIEEFSIRMNSPILTIPGISHFSGTSILAELGDICNYSKPSQLVKRAGVAPYTHESSQFAAAHTAIAKKGSRYLRKTLYQVILPVIRFNPVFQKYYDHKIAQGKGHRCAQGHCIRKLLRIIYHLLNTGQPFDPVLLR